MVKLKASASMVCGVGSKVCVAVVAPVAEQTTWSAPLLSPITRLTTAVSPGLYFSVRPGLRLMVGAVVSRSSKVRDTGRLEAPPLSVATAVRTTALSWPRLTGAMKINDVDTFLSTVTDLV